MRERIAYQTTGYFGREIPHIRITCLELTSAYCARTPLDGSKFEIRPTGHEKIQEMLSKGIDIALLYTAGINKPGLILLKGVLDGSRRLGHG